MNWYIGQEVVCIKTHSKGAVKKDEIYTIKGIYKPCCTLVLDVGIRIFAMNMECSCLRLYPSNNIWHIDESLFAPIEFDQQENDELLQNTLVITE